MTDVMLASSPPLLPTVLGKRPRTTEPKPRARKAPKSSGGSTPRPKNCVCPYADCEKRYARPARLDEHIRSTHTHDRAFRCEYPNCDKAFYRKSHLDAHVTQSHTKEFKYRCDVENCQASFVSGQRLRVHKASHERQIPCPYPDCGQVFRKKNVLQRHVARDHENKGAAQCTHPTSAASLSHDPADESAADTDTTLGICGEWFTTHAQLRRHESAAHGIMHYWCTLCADLAEDAGDPDAEAPGFATHTELLQHNRDVHPPGCEKCNISFKSAHLADEHNLVHHSELGPAQRSQYPCPALGCGKAFTRASNLNVHVRNVHDKERPFVCGDVDLRKSKGLEGWAGEWACGAGFGTKASLEGHVRRYHFAEGRVIRPEEREEKVMQTRQQRKRRCHSQKKGVRLSAMLTDGYAEDSGRKTACVVEGCDYRFVREYDLEQHLFSKHAMSEEAVAESLVEKQALQGGKFWMGGVDDELYVQGEEYFPAQDGGYLAAQDEDEEDGPYEHDAAAASTDNDGGEPFRFIAEGGLDA